MNMLVILIPLSLLLVAVAVWAFLWAVGSGQFDDLDSPAWDILSETTESSPTAPASVVEIPAAELPGGTAKDS